MINSRHWSTATKLSIMIAPPLVLFLTIIAWVFPVQKRLQLLEQQTTQTAEVVATQIKTDRKFYATVVVPRLLSMHAQVVADYHKVPNGFPLPATFVREAAEMIELNSAQYRVRLISPWPINKRSGIQDTFQEAGFHALASDPSSLYRHWDTVAGVRVMRFLAPDKAVGQSCVDCHNAHPDSPRHDFRLNDLMGGIEITIPVEAPFMEARLDQITLLAGSLGIAVVVIGLIVWGTRQVVTHPVRELSEQMEKIAAAQGEVAGTQTILSKTERAMGEEIRRLWQRFWDMHLALKASQEKRSAEIQRQAEAQQAFSNRLVELHRFTQSIQQGVSEEEVYRVLSHALQQLLGFRQIIILRLNASEDRLEIVWTDPKREELGLDSYPTWNEPWACPVIRSGREYLVQDVARDLTCRYSLSNDEEGGYRCVPLVIGGRTIGVVHLVTSMTRSWPDETRYLVEALVTSAAPMIGHLQHIERAKRRALTDELTGAFNRRFLDEVMAKMVRPGERREGQIVSLLMIDLDKFKAINDAFGHPVGDLVLKQITSILHRSLKSGDILVRFGGEEFAVLLPQTDNAGATVVAERLRATVEVFNLRQLAPGAPIRMTISVGVATYPDHAETPEDLTRKADEALYQAKSLGRNRVVCAQ